MYKCIRKVWNSIQQMLTLGGKFIDFFPPFCSPGHIQAESGCPSAKDWCLVGSWVLSVLGIQDSILYLEFSESYKVLP